MSFGVPKTRYFNYFSFGWLAEGISVVLMQKKRINCFNVGLNPSGPNTDKSNGAGAYYADLELCLRQTPEMTT